MKSVILLFLPEGFIFKILYSSLVQIIFLTRSTTPIETRRQKYEEFVQKLLQKPSLRGSDLLYTFLTTKQNFTILADTSVPIVSDLENIYQSVAHKLRKEKGQRLDPFMATFLASTETGQLKLKYCIQSFNQQKIIFFL